jgi:hypothetical protein
MKEYIALFDATARDLVAKGMTGDEITAELTKKLPTRGMAWMIDYNLKARYLGKK